MTTGHLIDVDFDGKPGTAGRTVEPWSSGGESLPVIREAFVQVGSCPLLKTSQTSGVFCLTTWPMLKTSSPLRIGAMCLAPLELTLKISAIVMILL